MLTRILNLSGALLVCIALTACSGSGTTSGNFFGNFTGNGGINLTGGTNTTIALAAGGGTTATAALSGYSGMLTYGATTNAGTNATITTMTSSPVTSYPSSPPGTSLVYFVLTVSQNATFLSSVYISQVTLPASVSTSGRTFYETAYDVTANTVLGSTSASSVSGQTLNFAGSAFATTSLSASHNYVFVISGS